MTKGELEDSCRIYFHEITMQKDELEKNCFRRMSYALIFLAAAPMAIMVLGIVLSILEK
jgi:hypothetical protein